MYRRNVGFDRIEKCIVRLPFGLCVRPKIEVRLHVNLGFEHGRLADLVQLLAHSNVMITDLEPDRSLYHVGMPERFTEVTFLVKNAKHKTEVFRQLTARGFEVRELVASIR